VPPASSGAATVGTDALAVREDRLESARALAVAQDPVLLYALDYLQRHGFRLPGEGTQAWLWCKARAEANDTEAQLCCGILCSLQLYGANCEDDSRKRLERLSTNGHPAAMLVLAGYAESGSLTPDGRSNSARMLELLGMATEQGYGPAFTQLGVLYLNGIYVPRDRGQGIALLRQAAMHGDARGLYLLGAALAEDSAPSVQHEGISYIVAASQLGYAGAYRHLGYLYSDGSCGLPRSEELSLANFFQATQIEQDTCALIGE